jgi:hypothetical protein
MTNPQKQKGDRAERDLVKWFQAHGYADAERARAGWEADKGDIMGIPARTIEVKSQKQLKVNEWLDETEVERKNGRQPIGLLIVKRPGQSDPGDWWVVQRVRDVFK